MIEDLEEREFNEYQMYIRPLFQTICKLWAHSKFYSTPARLIVLLQEVCNMLIAQVCLLRVFSWFIAKYLQCFLKSFLPGQISISTET